MQITRTPVAYIDSEGNEIFGEIVKTADDRTIAGPPRGVSYREVSTEELAQRAMDRMRRSTLSTEELHRVEADEEALRVKRKDAILHAQASAREAKRSKS